MKTLATTTNGALQYEHSMDHAVEFFSKAGNMRDITAVNLFKQVWYADREVAMKLLLWVRDVRGGAGNREGFRQCLKWLAENAATWVVVNIALIPELGRWDDLSVLYGTSAEDAAISLWANAIVEGNGLACKWADRHDKKLVKYFRQNIFKGTERKDSEKTLRKLLAKKTDVIETKMCQKNWTEIEYGKVPSVAMKRYAKAFGKNDSVGFGVYKEKLEKGEAKINAGAVYPYDLVHAVRSGDKAIADAQFAALPNFMEGTNKRIMSICDTSGSMSSRIPGSDSIQCVDVSMGLALYFSEKIGSQNPFYRKFLQFSGSYLLSDWNGMKFSEALSNRKVFNLDACNTNIEAALNGLLKSATFWKVSPEQMPNMLVIVSDMQFDQMCDGLNNKPVVESCMDKWEAAGYEKPTIVYWNVASHAGSPATVDAKNVALVSGFSPSTIAAVVSGADLTPKAIMVEAIKKYNIVVP